MEDKKEERLEIDGMGRQADRQQRRTKNVSARKKGNLERANKSQRQ
jgi:hypothetical protein